MMKTSKLSKRIPKFQWSWLIWIFAALILFSVAKYLFSAGGVLQGLFNPAGKGQEEQLLAAEKRAEGVQYNTAKMSKTWIEIQQRADQLYKAFCPDVFGVMGGLFSAGTDEKMMWKVLEGLNTEDLKALWRAFGVRAYETLWVPIFRGDLGMWFVAELSADSDDLKRVKQKFQGTGIWS